MKIDWRKIGIKDLAAIVAEKLRDKGIDSLVVGGACVSIYTQNKYLSSDIDVISHATLKQIDSAMYEIGFSRKRSRHFTRTGCPFFVEFVSPPAAVGKEPIKSRSALRTKFGTIILISPTDCVKDRLAAFFHWNDTQAFEQARMVAQTQDINMEEIRKWALKEGHSEKYKIFRDSLKKPSRKKGVEDMGTYPK